MSCARACTSRFGFGFDVVACQRTARQDHELSWPETAGARRRICRSVFESAGSSSEVVCSWGPFSGRAHHDVMPRMGWVNAWTRSRHRTDEGRATVVAKGMAHAMRGECPACPCRAMQDIPCPNSLIGSVYGFKCTRSVDIDLDMQPVENQITQVARPFKVGLGLSVAMCACGSNTSFQLLLLTVVTTSG